MPWLSPVIYNLSASLPIIQLCVPQSPGKCSCRWDRKSHPAPLWAGRADLCSGCQHWMGREGATVWAFPGAFASQPLPEKWCVHLWPYFLDFFSFVWLGNRRSLCLFLECSRMRNETNFSGHCNFTIVIPRCQGSEETVSGLAPLNT